MSIFDEHLSNPVQTTVNGFQDIIERFNSSIAFTRYVKNTHIVSAETQAILEQMVPILGKTALGINMVGFVLELISAYNAKNKNIFLAIQLSITMISLTMALIAPPALAIAFFSFSILNHLAILRWHWQNKESLQGKDLIYTAFKAQYTKTMTNRTLILMSTIAIIIAMVLTSYCSLAIVSSIAWLAVIGLMLTRMLEAKTGLLAKYVSPYKINTQGTEDDRKKFSSLLEALLDHAIKLNIEIEKNPNGFEVEKRKAKQEITLASIIFLLASTKVSTKNAAPTEPLIQNSTLIEILSKKPEETIPLEKDIAQQLEKLEKMDSEKIIDFTKPVIDQFKAFVAFKRANIRAISQSFFNMGSYTEELMNAVHHHLSSGVYFMQNSGSCRSIAPAYIPLACSNQTVSSTVDTADDNNSCANNNV